MSRTFVWSTAAVSFIWSISLLALSGFEDIWSKYIQPLCKKVSFDKDERGNAMGFTLLVVALPVLTASLVAAAFKTSPTFPTFLENVSQPSSPLCPRSPPWFRKIMIRLNFNVLSAVLVLVPCTAHFFGIVARMNGDPTFDFRRSMLVLGNVSGFLAVMAMAFLIVPVARSSPILEAMEWSPTNAIRIHIWAGSIAVIGTAHHGIVYLVKWAALDNGSFWDQLAPRRHCWTGTKFDHSCQVLWRNFFGILGGLALLILGFTGMNWIRRKAYILFYVVHIIMTPLVVFTVSLHWSPAFLYLAPGLILWMSTTLPLHIESRMFGRVKLVKVELIPSALNSSASLCSLTILASEALCKMFRSGMYVQLRAPALSQVAHPFSAIHVPKCPHQLRIIFRATGTFTKRLTEYVRSHPDPLLQMEAFYGAELLPQVLKHNDVAIIVGGVGITPFLSLMQEVRTLACNKIRLHLHWFCRDPALVEYIVREYDLAGLEATEGLHTVVYDTRSTSASDRNTQMQHSREEVSLTEEPGQGIASCITVIPYCTLRLPTQRLSFGSSGIKYSDNLFRFTLLLTNFVIGLSLTYYMYDERLGRTLVWSRAKAPLIVFTQCLAVTCGFLYIKLRFPSLFQNQHNWHQVPVDEPFLDEPDEEAEMTSEEEPREEDCQPDLKQGYRNARTFAERKAPVILEVERRTGRESIGNILVDAEGRARDAVFACGPVAMYRAVDAAAAREGVRVYKEIFEM